MSGMAAAARPRSRVLALRFEADAVGLALVGVAAVALAFATWGTWGDLGRDTGYDFVAATRVAHGQLPYVDFNYYYGPLAPFVLGLAALIGGSGIAPFAAVGLVLAVAVIGATYALARTQTGPMGSALAAIATAAIAFSPTNFSYVVPHTYSVTLAILLSLLFLLGLTAASNGRRAGALGAGVAAGLVALTRPEFELAVLVAGAVWLAARARGGAGIRRDGVALVLPAALIPAAVYGAFLTAVSPHRLFLENLYPVDTLRHGGSAIVRAQAPLTAHSFVVVAAYFALYAAGAGALVLASRGLARLRPLAATASVGVVALAVIAILVLDPEAARSKLQWVFGGVPVAAVLAAIVLVIRHVVRRHALDVRGQILIATVALLAVLAAKSYHGFFFLADHAQPAVYAAPFVLVLMARLHLVDLARHRTAVATGLGWLGLIALVCIGLTVKDAHAQSAAVRGPGGTMRVTSAEAPVYRGALAAINRWSRPGDSILVAPQLTALYTLSERSDPLPQISLVPGALASPGAEVAAIRALKRAHVRLALTDRHAFTEYGQTNFGTSFDRVLAGWIQRNFNHAATLRPHGGVDHTIDVWVRRTR
jgi:hypothetical protein